MKKNQANRMEWKKISKKMRNDWLLYLLIVPVVVWYLIFCYLPIAGGLSLSVRNFRFDEGIWTSPFVGLQHFQKMFADRDFMRATGNTIIISLGRIAFQMPCAILAAIFLNEIRNAKLKRTFQTVITFPHFISWVVLAGILSNIFGSSGIINQVLTMLGIENISPITTAATFRPFIWLSNIWKEVGWDSIIYLAAITSIDPGLYEAAEVDGAGRLQRIWHITLPSIRVTIVMVATLNIANILNAGFDQIYNMYSPVVYQSGDIIDTYVYRLSFVNAQYSLATAIGLLKSAISFIMIVTAHKMAKKFANYQIF